MHIRSFQPSDADQIARLFHDTIRQVNIRDYTEEQVRAWAPDDVHFRDWVRQCSQKFTFIAEVDGVVAGFAQLEPDGYIDCFYGHKDFQRRGVGTSLYRALEGKARELRLIRLYAEVSITAKPFFLRMGFTVVKEQVVAARGAQFTNFIMQKQLGA